MNQDVLHSSQVQHMMARNPNWWSINNTIPLTPQHHPPLPPPPSSSSCSSSSSSFTWIPNNYNSFLPQFGYIPTPLSSLLNPSIIPSWNDNQEQLPESWSQLLMGGLIEDEDKCGMLNQFQGKRLENSEEQVLYQTPNASVLDVKKEDSSSSYVYGHTSNINFNNNTREGSSIINWSPMLPASPSKSSTVTSLSTLDFSNKKKIDGRQPPSDLSSECNSDATGGAQKKAKIHHASTQSPFKQVRKEKLGDRISALHQLVSPFGKTDTASVLLEAIGYIRFLQNQIEALSTPYLGSGSGNNTRQQQAVRAERKCMFPEDPGQLLNDNSLKPKGASDQDSYEGPKKDLRNRGLCLVPVACTLQVGSDNGADYWASALGRATGGFR